jgi:hypothetical protein
MTTSQPKPSSRPKSHNLTVVSDLEKLEKAEEVINQPSKDVAINAGLIPAEGVGDSVKTEESTVKAEPQYPWIGVSDANQSVNFKMPLELFLKVKWLSDTEYGMNMTKLYIEAIEKEVAIRMKARGIE